MPQADKGKPLHHTAPDKMARFTSSSDRNFMAAQSKVWGVRHWMQLLKWIAGVEAPVAASLSALTVATMVSYFSPFYVSIAMSICCLVVSVSFAAAGSRMASLLSISADAATSNQNEGARHRGERQGNAVRNSLERHQDVGRSSESMPPIELVQSSSSQSSESVAQAESKGNEQVVTDMSYVETSRRTKDLKQQRGSPKRRRGRRRRRPTKRTRRNQRRRRSRQRQRSRPNQRRRRGPRSRRSRAATQTRIPKCTTTPLQAS